MELLRKVKGWIDEQKVRQFEKEKEELARLERDNVLAEEQFKVRVKLAKERARKKKFSKNPLDQKQGHLSDTESFFANSKRFEQPDKHDSYDSSAEFKSSDDFRSMVGDRYGKQ